MIKNPTEYNVSLIDKIPIAKRKKGNQGNNARVEYKNIITAFDIETTVIPYINQAVMYVWQFQIGFDTTIIGRTWDEFVTLIESISDRLKLHQYIVVYVHNLSYEFQFLRGIYDFKSSEVFALQPRKILKCTMYDHIEFRCSYIHSNMSLELYTNKFNVLHKKLSGEEFDYSIERYYFTPLKPKELEYATNDVLGLVEAITAEMVIDDDNLYTIPLTSTGYVRRDAKRAMRNISHHFVSRQLPDLLTYQLCKEAFRGGNTHANRYYAGQILENVKSADRSSSYPEVLCHNEFPVTAFTHVGKCTTDELLNLINKRHKAVLMRVAFTNIECHEDWGFPYISISKCRNLKNYINDNGRVLKAEYLETTLTDIDLKIILQEYDFDCLTPIHVSHARYGKLPQPIIDLNIQYYKGKTELKDIEDKEIYYMKDKNKLNSIYGMMAQDPVKQSIDFINGEFIEQTESIESLLAESNRKAFLCYQWGVWTTAHARNELEEGIKIATDCVYVDTDSTKYLGEADFTAYNNRKEQLSKENGTYATDKHGITHYMGVFEQEDTYATFKTLGAKKYAYTFKKGDAVHITISGVNKKKGAIELEKYGGLKAFKEGTIFKDINKLRPKYNDFPEVTETTIEGHRIDITANVALLPTTYELGITAEYMQLLTESRHILLYKTNEQLYN